MLGSCAGCKEPFENTIFLNGHNQPVFPLSQERLDCNEKNGAKIMERSRKLTLHLINGAEINFKKN